MTIGICDCQLREGERLRLMLEDYLKQEKLSGMVLIYSSGHDLLYAARKTIFDTLFLEVAFPEPDGLSTAWAVRRLFPECSIIFHTRSRDYALAAFDIGAIHYLLKPVSAEKLSEAMNRCVRKIPHVSQEALLEIIVARSKVQIRQEQILYLESYGKQTCVHTKSRIYYTWNSITQIRCILDPRKFLKIQRSYIIHMGFIQFLNGKSCTLRDGMVLSVSRKYCSSIKAKYATYLQSRDPSTP